MIWSKIGCGSHVAQSCGAQGSYEGSHYYIAHMPPSTRIPNWQRCICEGWSDDCKLATLHSLASPWAIYWAPDLTASCSPSRFIAGFISGVGTGILKYIVFAMDALLDFVSLLITRILTPPWADISNIRPCRFPVKYSSWNRVKFKIVS